MPAYAPRPRRHVSPKALATVIGFHAAGLAVLLTVNPDFVIPPDYSTTIIDNIPIDPPPPEMLPQQAPEASVLPPVSQQTNPPPIQQLPNISGTTSSPVIVDAPPLTMIADVGTIIAPDPGPPLIEIRSTEASLLTPPDRARPPYPASKVRMGDEAVLPLKLTIGANGRVTHVEAVGEVDRVFFNAARRHILKIWRYAPAMKGDRKVESVKTIRLRFELEG
ncbi:MAG: hypothetical protein HKO13_08695 [Sphingomonas sp.]|nr:hypothetical protein [Sphingomonas sp.]RZV49638.1 MAG: hypothetical protein EX258_06915 [Sphingomonadaceae bacterium]